MSGALQTPDLLSLNRNVSFECQDVFNFPTDEVWPTKARKISSNTFESVHAYVETVPEMRESVGDRIYYGLTARTFTVRNKHYDLGIKLPSLAFKYDALGVFRDVPGIVRNSVATWGDKIITDLQLANGLCVDGQNFYDVDHPVNMDDPSKGIFVNDFTAKPINVANVFAGVIAMRNVKGANGVKLGLKATVLEYPSDEELNVYNVLQNPTTAQLIKNNAGSENVGGIPIANLLPLIVGLKPVENPRLPSGTWYLHSTNRFMPFIFQVAEEPSVLPEFDPRDPRALNQREIAWAVDAHGAPAYALPHCSMRFATT